MVTVLLGCALHVFMGSVLLCALRVFTCALHVSVWPTWSLCCVRVCSWVLCSHVLSVCSHVLSVCVSVCSLWRQDSLSSVHRLKRLLGLQAFILRRWTQLRRGQGQTTILLWSHLFLLLFSCFLVTKVLSKIPFYFLYYL